MIVKRHQIGIVAGVVLACSLVFVVAASPVKHACPDDQDGTCTLSVDRINANTGSFLNGWVEAGSFFGKSSVHAGSSDQTTLDGNGLYAGLVSVGTVYANVVSAGTIYGSFKYFRIDDPIDPANRFLNHWSVESSEMKNIYDGIVTLDASGAALVTMPAWFDSLNGDFRYQLTAIGAPGADLYIAEELSNRQFKIAGGKPHLKVSWQVTGIRHDASARNSHVQVEEDKPAQDRGKYLDPVAFGKPESMGIPRTPSPEPSGRTISRRQ
jgi:hypothetical protein